MSFSIKEHLSPHFHIREGCPQVERLQGQLKNLGFHPALKIFEGHSHKKETCPRADGLNFLKSLPDHELGFTYRVACGRRILSIPQNSEQALDMLTLLSGRRHQVWIGFGGKFNDRFRGRMIQTRISFKRLTAQEISHQAQQVTERLCSGAYDPGGQGARFIKSLNGSPAALGGLPLYEFLSFLHPLKMSHDAV